MSTCEAASSVSQPAMSAHVHAARVRQESQGSPRQCAKPSVSCAGTVDHLACRPTPADDSLRRLGKSKPSKLGNDSGELCMFKHQTSVILWLSAAGISFLLSVYSWFLVDRDTGLFVGLWVPSILAAGSLISSLRSRR